MVPTPAIASRTSSPGLTIHALFVLKFRYQHDMIQPVKEKMLLLTHYQAAVPSLMHFKNSPKSTPLPACMRMHATTFHTYLLSYLGFANLSIRYPMLGRSVAVFPATACAQNRSTRPSLVKKGGTFFFLLCPSGLGSVAKESPTCACVAATGGSVTIFWLRASLAAGSLRQSPHTKELCYI